MFRNNSIYLVILLVLTKNLSCRRICKVFGSKILSVSSDFITVVIAMYQAIISESVGMPLVAHLYY